MHNDSQSKVCTCVAHQAALLRQAEGGCGVEEGNPVTLLTRGVCVCPAVKGKLFAAKLSHSPSLSPSLTLSHGRADGRPCLAPERLSALGVRAARAESHVSFCVH